MSHARGSSSYDWGSRRSTALHLYSVFSAAVITLPAGSSRLRAAQAPGRPQQPAQPLKTRVTQL
eukprot:359870-Chlamydomonas_euryale.AAC.2